MRSSANFSTVFSENQNANPLDAKLKTHFNAKWPFKVIYFGVNEEPQLRVYIAYYNKHGLKCESSEDIACEISENRHFRWPHSHLKPPRQRTPANIHINLISLETASLQSRSYIFVADSMGLSSFRFLWWIPKDIPVCVSNKAHKRHSRSIEGHSRLVNLEPIESAYAVFY